MDLATSSSKRKPSTRITHNTNNSKELSVPTPKISVFTSLVKMSPDFLPASFFRSISSSKAYDSAGKLPVNRFTQIICRGPMGKAMPASRLPPMTNTSSKELDIRYTNVLRKFESILLPSSTARAGPESNADIHGFQGGSVVHSVACHGHYLSHALIHSSDPKLVLRSNPSENF